MAYNTKPIVTDKDGNPISQYYNKELDQYEPLEGQAGANKVVLYNADGTENNSLSLQPILDKLSQLTGTVIDEETRKSNEIERQNNEQNRIQLYDALLAELERIEQIEQQVPESVLEAVYNLKNEIGNLLELQTNEKSNLIGAINEINQKVENIEIVDMDAVNVSYDNTESEIEAENVQDAIDEINENLTAHKAEKVTDATNPHGTFTEFADRAVNVKWFGAVGDGVTDDTKALQDALASLGDSGGLVFLPAGTYLYNETLVIGSGQTIAGVGSYNGSTLLYAGSGSAVDIGLGGCLSKIEVKKDPSLWTGDWNLANPVSGVRLTGLMGRAEDICIRDFEIGLHLIGAGDGCAYNQIFLRLIYNCHKAIVLDATTVDGAMGWVNENTIYGGRIGISSSLHQSPSYSTTWGIYMDSHTTYYPNNNKFIGISVEGANNGIRVVGTYNTFFNPRIEIPGTVKLLFQNLTDSGGGLCQYNWFFGLYGTNFSGTHPSINVFAKKADGSDLAYNENMIICRGASLPLHLTNDGLSFAPSYRHAHIKYNTTDYCFEFWHDGNKIATLNHQGNLKIKGTLSQDQTF